MDIKIVEPPPQPLRKMTPEEVAEGRQTVLVWLERPVTLQVENAVVTYPAGTSEAPCVVANALVAAGAELLGPDGVRRPAAAKPERVKGQPTPSRGGLAGSMRTGITYPKFGPNF